MNKGELVAAMAEAADVSQKDAGACLDAMFDIIASQVSAGNEVSITGWMKIEKAKTNARTGRNPQTGEAVPIKAGHSPAFKAGKKLKDAVR